MINFDVAVNEEPHSFHASAAVVINREYIIEKLLLSHNLLRTEGLSDCVLGFQRYSVERQSL